MKIEIGVNLILSKRNIRRQKRQKIKLNTSSWPIETDIFMLVIIKYGLKYFGLADHWTSLEHWKCNFNNKNIYLDKWYLYQR